MIFFVHTLYDVEKSVKVKTKQVSAVSSQHWCTFGNTNTSRSVVGTNKDGLKQRRALVTQAKLDLWCESIMIGVFNKEH